MTGLYLWWPRTLSAVFGVWLLRFRAPAYTILRDLHSVPGALFAVVALLLALTGLFYTQVWGGTYSGLFGRYPEYLTDSPARPAAGDPAVPVATVSREARPRRPPSRRPPPPAPRRGASHPPAPDRPGVF